MVRGTHREEGRETIPRCALRIGTYRFCFNSASVSLVFLEKGPGPLRRFHDSLDQRDAEPSLLEFQYPVYGDARGSGHLVLQLGGVLSRDDDVFGGPQDGLRGEFYGDIARKSQLHSAVGQGFYYYIDIGGALYYFSHMLSLYSKYQPCG